MVLAKEGAEPEPNLDSMTTFFPILFVKPKTEPLVQRQRRMG